MILAILLLVSILFVPCARNGTPTEKETIDLDGFTITLGSPKVDFPDSIEFEIEAQSEAEITDISLQYRMDKMSIFPVTNVVFPQFAPGEKTRAEWKWDMTQTGGLPPGADLSYWWTIEDASGHETETPHETLSFDDGRHDWQEIHSTSFTLYWYSGDSGFAQKLVDAGEEGLDLLAEDIGARPERSVEVYIYDSTEALQGSLVYPDPWTGGEAFSEYGIVALGVGTSSREVAWGEGAMAHEMAHLVVHQVTMNGYGISLPTWLDEGLAMYAEGPLASSFASALSSAVKSGNLDSVQSLSSSFPADTAGAYLAYAESYSVVDYLLGRKGGEANMLAFLAAFKSGSGQEEALREVYGLSPASLDSQWKSRLTAGGV